MIFFITLVIGQNQDREARIATYITYYLIFLNKFPKISTIRDVKLVDS